MLPNLRVIAASLVASIALITFGFGLFAAFRIANQSSVVFAHPNDVPARPVFAQGTEETPAGAPSPTADAQPTPAVSDNASHAPQAETPAAPASPPPSGSPPAVAESSPIEATPEQQTAPPVTADAAPSAEKPAYPAAGPAAPAVSAPAPEASTPTTAAAPAPVEAPPAPAASAPVPETLPASTPTTAATPAPADVHADDAVKPATRAPPAVVAVVAPPNPPLPETTASIKHPAGAKKTIKPRHAPVAPQAKQKTKLAKPMRKPPVRRVVRRIAPRPQVTAQPGMQPTAQPTYSYSNWSSVNNAQWARQPAWQTPAQPKARSTAVSPAKTR